MHIKHSYRFGHFLVDSQERRLFQGSQLVNLTPKVFDVLLVLVENHGRVVTKDELLQLVWPDSFVEEGNLNRNISTLRKILGRLPNGDKYIETAHKRGYTFIAPIQELFDLEINSQEPESEHPEIPQPSSDDFSENLDFPPAPYLSVNSYLEVQSGNLPETGDGIGRTNQLPGKKLDQSLTQSKFNQRVYTGTLLVWLCFGGLLFFRVSQKPPLPLPKSVASIKSIAILPFKNLETGLEENDLGMADAVHSRLSHLPGIVIRPLNTTRKFMDVTQDLPEIAQKLNVEAVLSGTIQRSGSEIQIRVQLVDTRSNLSIWAEKFETRNTSYLEVQTKISEKIAQALRLHVTDEQRQYLTKRYTENLEAYQLYVQGRYFWSKRTEEGLRKGMGFFSQALEKAPNYAPAYAGLADCYALLSVYADVPPENSCLKAKEIAHKALALDDSLAEAHTSLAFVALNYDWDWVTTEKELKQAIELNPNSLTAYHWYGLFLTAMGRFQEGRLALLRAKEIDPESLPVEVALGEVSYYERHYQDAIQQFLAVIKKNPQVSLFYDDLGKAYVQNGMPEEALQAFQKTIDLTGDKIGQGLIGYAYAVSGKETQARKILAELHQQATPQRPLLYDVCVVYVGLGDHDQALQYLRIMCDRHEPHVIGLKVNPIFDSLRSDPRFIDLLYRVGLN